MTGAVLESTEIKTTTNIIVFGGKAGEILGPNSDYDKRRLLLLSEHQKTVEAAKIITSVETPEQAELATEIGRTLQGQIQESEMFFKPVKSQIDDIKKPVLEAEKKDITPMQAEKVRIGSLLTAYSRKVAAERERVEREARAAADRAAQEAQLDRAIELEAEGDIGQAEAVLEDAPIAVAVVTGRSAPVQVAGQIGRKTYRAEVTNLLELVKAVAAGKVHIGALKADESFLNKQANAFRESFDYPGCRLVVEAKTHFRK
jgi:hypothetical protein